MIRMAGIKRGKVLEKIEGKVRKRKEIIQHEKMVTKERKQAQVNLQAFVEKEEAREDAAEKAIQALEEEAALHTDSNSHRERRADQLKRLRDASRKRERP